MSDFKNNIAVMIDLETLATTECATILSMGYVVWNLDEKEFHPIFDSHFAAIDITSQERFIDPQTLTWHMKSPEQFKRYFHMPQKLNDCLHTFAHDMNMFAGQTANYWSKPADFDLTMLEHAFARHPEGVGCPWNFRQRNCFRTMFNAMKHLDTSHIKNAEEHNAIEDALYQAKLLHFYLGRIKANV